MPKTLHTLYTKLTCDVNSDKVGIARHGDLALQIGVIGYYTPSDAVFCLSRLGVTINLQ